MDRKYFKTPIDELEALFKENLNHRQVLGDIRDELTHRDTPRARQLLREVDGVLAGVVPAPDTPPGPDRAENQLDLLGDQRE
jgi:hypothetical protein